ncbi:MAG: P-loop NTPase [Candidatus Omnitrophica bacterium]|nr:P-loop NTPase [Candidatus Omnitrophota bacterium]
MSELITEEDIRTILKQIIDPDLRQDIVSLGFVQNILIQGSSVSFDIALTTPACPIKSEFPQKAEEVVRALPGVETVSVRMTTLSRASSVNSAAPQSSLGKVRSIIAVSSCKGGVGKSTIAALLSLDLAQRGFRVGLVDTDIYGPSIPTLFNLKNVPMYTNAEQQLIPVGKYGLKLMSFGFLLGDAPAVIRGPLVARYVQQILHNTAWGELDYLFLDLPPGTGDVQLTITQTTQLSGAVIVTTRQTLSLVDVARGILMFEKVNVPVLGVIENMAYFTCDNCQKRHDIFGGNTQSLLDRFGLNTLAEIPLLPELTHTLNGPVQNPIISQAVDQTIRALGKSSVTQKQIPKIKFDAKHVILRWPDNKEMKILNRDLRISCGCALCVDELTGKQILKPQDVSPDIAPKSITPLGNYAIGIEWNDGHSSGIYPYKNIRALAEKL